MKNRKLIQCLNFFILFLLITWFSSSYINVSTNSETLFVDGDEQSPYSNLVTLNTFPVDLDLLFWADNLTMRNQNLNALGNGTHGWMLTPWGGHFHSGHHEGADKWYLYGNRYLEVVAPHDGQFESNPHVGNGTITQIKGNDVVVDLGVDIDIGQDCTIGLAHINLLESIYNEIENTGTYVCTEGELLGYTPGPWALDFHYYINKYEGICPFPALSTNLQVKLGYYFTLQYERAKIGGTFPESNICVPLEISIENTVWGVWQYKTGPYDSYFASIEDIGYYQPGFLTVFNREFVNPETFHKDPKDNTKNLTEDTIGILKDGFTATDIPEYTSVSECLIELVQGNSSDGIFELINNYISEWGPGNTSVFAKFSIIKGQASSDDDLLEIEYFDNLVDAQVGFTADKIIYDRFYENWYLNPTGSASFKTITSVMLFLELFIVLVFFRKRKTSKSL